MSDVLIIDADWDLATRYGRAFREKFLFNDFHTEWPSYTIHHLVGPDAVQFKVNAFIDENNVKYLSGMGHGTYDSFTGFQNESIWHSDDDLSRLAGTIVHLLSCQTGAVLGKTMIKDGALAFWGYTVNFSFYRTMPPPSDLANDSVAEIYLKMDSIIDRGILGRKDANAIYDSVTAYVATVLPQLKSKQFDQAVLLDNYVHLVCPATVWGSATAIL
jgi:hypothetical protein